MLPVCRDCKARGYTSDIRRRHCLHIKCKRQNAERRGDGRERSGKPGKLSLSCGLKCRSGVAKADATRII